MCVGQEHYEYYYYYDYISHYVYVFFACACFVPIGKRFFFFFAIVLFLFFIFIVLLLLASFNVKYWAKDCTHRLIEGIQMNLTKPLRDAVGAGWRLDFHFLRSYIYNWLIVGMTTKWYREVLHRLPDDVRVLDVGIGTAEGLLANEDLIRSKHLSILGVDYDESYVKEALLAVERKRLQDHVAIKEMNFMKFNENKENKVDVVYFSGSFMCFPDQVGALKHALGMLSEKTKRLPVSEFSAGGNEMSNADDKSTDKLSTSFVVFTQSFEKNNFFGRRITPLIKNLLSLVTTIDFGTVTFESDFAAVLNAAGAKVVERKIITSTFNHSRVLVIVRNE